METLPDADLERRFGSLARLYGQMGADRIRQGHVVVVGLGGVVMQSGYVLLCLIARGKKGQTGRDRLTKHLVDSMRDRYI